MELVIQAAGICVVATLLGLTFRRGNPEMTLLLTVAVIAVVLSALSAPLRELLDFLDRLAEQAGVPQALLLPLYKTVGIAMVVKVGGGLCRDAGESALSSVLELTGTICALLVALPLFRAVLDLLGEWT